MSNQQRHMPHAAVLTALVLTASVLQGCQTLSASQCETLNWSEKGVQDASQGQQDQFAKYTSACDQHKIPLSQSANTAYQTGYRQGLTVYCQPLTVYKLASEGRGQVEVCPVAQHGALQLYWMTANQLYQTQRELESLLNQKQSAEQTLADPNTKEKYKASARERLRGLPEKIAIARAQASQAESAAQRLMSKHL